MGTSLVHQGMSAPSTAYQDTGTSIITTPSSPLNDIHCFTDPASSLHSLGLSNFDVQLSQIIPQTLLFGPSTFPSATQYGPAQVQHDAALAPHTSTSRTRVEDTLTQVTSNYGVALIPVRAGEGSSGSSQRNNVISARLVSL